MISIITNRIAYSGDAVNLDFPYPFRVDDKAWLLVYVNNVLLIEGTDYTVSGVGLDAGGTISALVAPGIGVDNVIVLRETPITQLTTLPSAGVFPSATIERLIADKLCMMIQDIHTILGTAAAGKLVKWDAIAKALVTANSAISDLETTDVSSGLTASQGITYFKGSKFVIAFNHAGTKKYRYLDLTSVAATWVYTTVAP